MKTEVSNLTNMRRIFHLQIKSDNSHKYYGSLSAVIVDKYDLGVSQSTLEKFDFDHKDFENEKVIIRKSILKTKSQVLDK